MIKTTRQCWRIFRNQVDSTMA